MRGEVTTDTTEIQRSAKEDCRQFYANRLNNLREIDKFLETFNFPRQNQEKIEN